MEKSSLDYREKLYSQIQEEYGKLVYTYTCHFKMADRLSKRNFWIKGDRLGYQQYQQVSTDNSRDCLGKVLRYIAG